MYLIRVKLPCLKRKLLILWNEGAKIAVKRVVVKDNQVVIEDTIRTTYQPWGSVYEFGPEAKLPEGAVIIEPKEDVENDI